MSLVLLAYTVEGGVSALLNGLIVLAILRHKTLRQQKEMVPIASLALADCGNAAAFVWSGLQRFYHMYQGTLDQPASSWECFQLYNVLWYVCFPCANAMLAVVSLDRFIAMAAPLTYFTLTRAYSLYMCGAVWLLQLAQVPILAAFSYANRAQPPSTRYCLSDDAIREHWYRTYFYGSGTVFGALSILLYVAIVVNQVLRDNKKRAAQYGGGAQNYSDKRLLRQRERDFKRQKRLMITLGISSAFSLLLVVIPQTVHSLFRQPDNPYFMYTGVIGLWNPMLNLALYVLRHTEMRAAVKSVLTSCPCGGASPVVPHTNNNVLASIKTASGNKKLPDVQVITPS